MIGDEAGRQANRRFRQGRNGREESVKCDCCSSPATIHLTDIVSGHKKEVHLCQDCAEQKKLIHKQELNLSAILETVIGQHVGAKTDELSRLTCPVCGIKYMEFRAEGRLGCPHDYQAFQSALEPLLQRIHRNCKHVGKVPRHARANAASQAELLNLRRQLRSAVEKEAYEEAAQLRDLLREKESLYESG
jgi:protein arginine kinase activator